MEKVFDLTLELREKNHVPDLRRILDPEKLLRLNPNWFIDDFNMEQGLATAKIRDYVTDEESQVAFRILSASQNPLEVEFDRGVVERIVFKLRDRALFARATARDLELTTEAQDNIRLWLKSIGSYLRLYLTTTVNRLFFRVWLNHFMLKMNPSQRKISIMIMKITVVEILVILLIVLGYVVFMQ
ncbi:MAG: hypothetical protein R3231_05235 [bacterium]|nr:hypothetical protein [bacterium]